MEELFVECFEIIKKSTKKDIRSNNRIYSIKEYISRVVDKKIGMEAACKVTKKQLKIVVTIKESCKFWEPLSKITNMEPLAEEISLNVSLFLDSFGDLPENFDIGTEYKNKGKHIFVCVVDFNEDSE